MLTIIANQKFISADGVRYCMEYTAMASGPQINALSTESGAIKGTWVKRYIL
jgi:hypothetical protein